MLTLGVGMFIGAKVAGYIETACTPEEYTVLERVADISDEDYAAAQQIHELKQIDWQKLWGIPAIFAAGVLVFFFIAFKDDSASGDSSATEPTDNPYEGEAEPETYASLEMVQPDGTACDLNSDGSTGD